MVSYMIDADSTLHRLSNYSICKQTPLGFTVQSLQVWFIGKLCYATATRIPVG
jgi:hypothetical protein